MIALSVIKILSDDGNAGDDSSCNCNAGYEGSGDSNAVHKSSGKCNDDNEGFSECNECAVDGNNGAENEIDVSDKKSMVQIMESMVQMLKSLVQLMESMVQMIESIVQILESISFIICTINSIICNNCNFCYRSEPEGEDDIHCFALGYWTGSCSFCAFVCLCQNFCSG